MNATSSTSRPSERPLSIGVLVDQFPELSETFIASELHALRAVGHRVHVEALAHAPNPNRAAAEEVDVAYSSEDDRRARLRDLAWLVARHPRGVVADLVGRRRWRRDEEVRPLRRLAPVARRLSRSGAGHLHAHFAAGAALDAMRIGALLGLPYSVMTHGYDIFKLPRNLKEKHDRAAFAATPCAYSARYLRERFGVDSHVIVMGVDAGHFRRHASQPGDGPVLAVGRLVEKKGFRHLVEAAALLPEARVQIVGDGPLREELQTIAGPNVELLGSRPPDEVRELLERASVVAVPCVVAADGDRDTMPVVAKEALAMEVPVVASDEVGLPEVVAPGWGRLVPPGDAGALAAALGELLELPPERRAELGRAGREHVIATCDVRAGAERLAHLIEAAAPRST